MERIEMAKKNSQKWFQEKLFIEDGYDLEFKEIAQNFLCGDILEYGRLSNRQKALITLTALTVCQTLKPVYKYTISALDVGVSPGEIKETLYQCAPYIGIEKVRSALDEVNKAFSDRNITSRQNKQSTVEEKNRFEKGLAVQQKIFGKENINAMRTSAPKELQHIQDYLSAYCFGDFYTRGILDLKMRELITFCAICCLGGCETQAKAHANANLSVGNTREILIEVLTQCLPFIGFPRTLNGIACINEVTK